MWGGGQWPDIVPAMISHKPCPVHGCTQPHLGDLARVLNQPMPPIRLPDAWGRGWSDPAVAQAVEAGMNAAATANAAQARKVMDDHALTHTLAEYLATINQLQRDHPPVTGRVAATHQPQLDPAVAAGALAVIHQLQLDAAQVTGGIRPHRVPPRADPEQWPEPTMVI